MMPDNLRSWLRACSLLVPATACVLCGAASALAGQSAASAPITVSDAKTPDSPALVLIGTSPSQVERPTTPRALAVNLLTSSVKSDNLIPQNYAIEVAPYWLVSHPALTSDEYYHPGVTQGMLNTLSFSAVSARVSTTRGQRSDASEVGVGVRAGIFVGHAGPDVQKQIKRIHALQLEYLAAQSALARYLAPAPSAVPVDPEFQNVIKMVSDLFDLAARTTDAEQKAQYAAAERALRGQLADWWNQAHPNASQSALESGAD